MLTKYFISAHLQQRISYLTKSDFGCSGRQAATSGMQDVPCATPGLALCTDGQGHALQCQAVYDLLVLSGAGENRAVYFYVGGLNSGKEDTLGYRPSWAHKLAWPLITHAKLDDVHSLSPKRRGYAHQRLTDRPQQRLNEEDEVEAPGVSSVINVTFSSCSPTSWTSHHLSLPYPL